MFARLWSRAWSPMWRLLTIAVLMLLAHSLWGYIEARRFEGIARRIQAETPRYPGARPWNTDPEDAGRFYRAAWALAIRLPKHAGLWQVSSRSALQRQRDQEWLVVMQPALEMSDRAAALASCCAPWRDDLARPSGLSEVLRAGSVRTRESLDAGDSAAALRSLASSFQHLRALAPEGSRIGPRIRPWTVVGVLADAEYFLDRSRPGDERAQLQRLVDAQIAPNPIEAALIAERSSLLDEIGRSLACGSCHPYLDSWVLRPFVRHTAVSVLTHMSEAIAVSRASWPERIRRLAELRPPRGIARIYAPDLKRLAYGMGRSAALVHAMSACLRVEQHRFEHGALPETLDTSAPIDPFTGQPLKYRRDDDGYVIYSVGEDGKDDGGSVAGELHGRLPKDYGYRIRTHMSTSNDLK